MSIRLLLQDTYQLDPPIQALYLLTTKCPYGSALPKIDGESTYGEHLLLEESTLRRARFERRAHKLKQVFPQKIVGESTFSGDNTLGEHFFQGRTLLGENFFCRDLTVFSGGESTRRHFPGLGPRAEAEAGAEADKGFIRVMFHQLNVRYITKSAIKFS